MTALALATAVILGPGHDTKDTAPSTIFADR
jgi:hypothetical protein